MSMTRIDDLSYEINGDWVNLEQGAGCGEVSYLTLHRIHLAHLVREAGLPVPDDGAQRTIAKLAARLRKLRERIDRAAYVIGEVDSLSEDEEASTEQLEVWYLRDLAEDLTDDLDDLVKQPANQNRHGFAVETEPKPNGFGNQSANSDRPQLDLLESGE